MKIRFDKGEMEFDGRWRIPWNAIDEDTGGSIGVNVASFGRDYNKPPAGKDIDSAFAGIETWLIQHTVDASDAELAAAEKEAYYERWGVEDDEELIKKCIEADADPDDLNTSISEATL